MRYEAILFDLDGTLLPMDQERFVKTYFSLLAKKAAPFGYQPEKLINTVWLGMEGMIKNDGTRTNEEAFWTAFTSVYGAEAVKDKALFEDFYQNEFIGAKAVCGFNPAAAKTVRALKAQGCRVVLATNPVFPAVATNRRIGWAGLSPDDFELVTTYENSRFCKPNPAYYTEICRRTGITPEKTLMVGNDVGEDGAAGNAGMGVFFITACLINKGGKPIESFPHGNFDDLLCFVGSHT